MIKTIPKEEMPWANRLNRRIFAKEYRTQFMIDKKYRIKAAIEKQKKLIREARRAKIEKIKARTLARHNLLKHG
jgi:abortive infection bacteriophage resistance protein